MGLSKGIDAYVYLSGARHTAKIKLRGNKDRDFEGKALPEAGFMESHHGEIANANVRWYEKSGPLNMEGSIDGKRVFKRFAEINPLTGNLGKTDLGDMLNTKSIIKDGYAISYGFADAGMDNRHQAWLYLTDDQSDWMGRAIDRFDLMDRAFGTFVLPGSHDAGMFTGLGTKTEAGDLLRGFLLEKVHWTLKAVSWMQNWRTAGEGVVLAVSKLGFIRTILMGLTYTQKDDIATQLALGTRYFDFRPGYNVPGYRKDEVLRAQHAFAPGCTFASFLSDIVAFLRQQKREIVVAQIKFDGFVHPESMKPDAATIDRHLADALEDSGIAPGSARDLDRKVGDLLAEHKRFIVLRDNDPCADSYSDDAYATDDPANVLRAVDQTLSADRNGAKWTVLQLQGTYTNKIKTSVTDAIRLTSVSDATSPLLFTKAMFDHKTYPWLMHSDNRFAARAGAKLVVLLNDFVDNALTDYAFSLTGRRAEHLKP